MGPESSYSYQPAAESGRSPEEFRNAVLSAGKDHGLEIRESQSQYPEVALKPGIFEGSVGGLERRLSALVDYLNMPIIVDDFKDHPSRVKWKQQAFEGKDPAFAKMFENNKLRGNVIGEIHEYFGLLQALLASNAVYSDRADALEAIAEAVLLLPVEGNYNTLSLEEKIRQTELLSGYVKKYLDLATHPVEKFTGIAA